MKLHFDYKNFKEFDFNDLLARHRDKEHSPDYNLFMHFLDFISIDSKEFLLYLLSEHSDAFNLDFISKDFCVLDLPSKSKKEMLAITERTNQRFNVNFCPDFYYMIFIEFYGYGLTYRTSNLNRDPINLDYLEKELTFLKNIINDYIKFELPIPLNIFLTIYKSSAQIRPYTARIPAQTFHSLKKSFDLLYESRSQIYENYDDYITAFECNGITDLVNASMYEITRNSYRINKCSNCGRYFVPYLRADAIYCDRPINDGSNKTCKDVGADKAWQEKLKNNEDVKLYRKIYSAKLMQIKRTPEHVSLGYKESLKAFKAETDEWKAKIKESKDETEKKKIENEYIKRLYEWKARGGTWTGEK